MIYSTATVPVNAHGETKLTREQAWKGLELKVETTVRRIREMIGGAAL